MRDAKRIIGFADARITSLRACERMFTMVASALAVLIHIASALVKKPSSWLGDLLRGERSRHRSCSEVRLVRGVTEVFNLDACLWDVLDPRAKLNLEAGL